MEKGKPNRRSTKSKVATAKATEATEELTTQQASVLAFLRTGGATGMASGEISRKLRVSQSSVVQDLGTLQARGLAYSRRAVWRVINGTG